MTEFTIIPENVEKVLEIVNLAVALIAGMYAIKLAALSQGGSMEKTWNYVAIVAVLFVVLEVNNALKGFGILAIHGLGDIVELAFVSVLAFTLYFTRKDLMKKAFG
ncbi:MAG: hypothetical protein Q8L30_00335 [bacterium]|nr:hypothetical protein [bacterium]